MNATKRFLEHSVNCFNRKYEAPVRRHLLKVYLMLGSMIGMASFGSMMYIKRSMNIGIASTFVSLFVIVILHCSPCDGKKYYVRLVLLYVFGFSSGQSVAPLVLLTMKMNPFFIVTAFVGSILTFVLLSLASLYARIGAFSFYSGAITKAINFLVAVNLINLLVGSYIVQLAQVYMGVFVMTAFTLLDTQNVVHKVRMGDADVVQDAMDLYLDLVALFRPLLIITMLKSERRRRMRRPRPHRR